MADLVVVVVVAVLLGAAIRYIVKEKKRGTRCIGCADAGSCMKQNSGCSCSVCGHSAGEKDSE